MQAVGHAACLSSKSGTSMWTAHLRLSSASSAIPRHCWALLKFCTPMLEASPLQQHAWTGWGAAMLCMQAVCHASSAAAEPRSSKGYTVSSGSSANQALLSDLQGIL